VNPDSLLTALGKRGFQASVEDRTASTATVHVPTLQARVLLNVQVDVTAGDEIAGKGYETIVEAPSKEAREVLTEVLESVLSAI